MTHRESHHAECHRSFRRTRQHGRNPHRSQHLELTNQAIPAGPQRLQSASRWGKLTIMQIHKEDEADEGVNGKLLLAFSAFKN